MKFTIDITLKDLVCTKWISSVYCVWMLILAYLCLDHGACWFIIDYDKECDSTKRAYWKCSNAVKDIRCQLMTTLSKVSVVMNHVGSALVEWKTY